ncbi:MAG: gliding motility-associated C-terminal domain-containing protein [Bacteroidia bacterium]
MTKFKFPIKTLLFLTALFLCNSGARAQVFYNNGATVFMDYGSIVQANGGAENSNSGQLTNHGDFHISSNGAPGNLTLSNSAVTQGNGKYFVELDFINNASFTQDNSEVIMNSTSANQQITGTQSTVFHKLSLPSAGTPGLPVCSLTLNASADSLVSLTDRELSTGVNTFFVLSPDPSIVTNTTIPNSEGFVSSLAPGTLSRQTNTTSSYVFPVGSSVVLKRYRPVDITPNAAAASEYTVRFVNHDPDLDSYLRTTNDGIPCVVNDTFYHAILRPNGATPADIKLYYIASTDGNWTNMSHWRTTNTMWNDMSTANSGTSGLFSTLVRPSWLFANPGDPYVMTVIKPGTPTITCPGNVCSNNPLTTFSANSSTTGVNYNWTAPGGSTILNGQGTGAVNVNWNSPGQFIYVNASLTVNGTTCTSLFSDSCSVALTAAPNTNLTASANPLNELDYSFVDGTTPSATSWNWIFGDGSTSTQQNPGHLYGSPGVYTVYLSSSVNGCTDIDSMQVTVDYNETIVIPNVFTPDGDGINDELFITYKGIKEFNLLIYNRWGQKMYTAEGPNFHWDGKDPSGQYVTDGTYFYIITAKSYADKDYDLRGSLYVFKKK